MAPEGELKFQSVLEEPEVQIQWAQRMLKHARNHPLGSFGAGIVIAMTFLAIFAESLTVYDPVLNDFEVMLTAPGDKFFFGTDQFGRDVLTRIIYGSRTALFVGLTAAFFGSVIGLVLGVASAYFGGRFDLLLQRVMDVFMAFPLIIMALAIVATLGPSSSSPEVIRDLFAAGADVFRLNFSHGAHAEHAARVADADLLGVFVVDPDDARLSIDRDGAFALRVEVVEQQRHRHGAKTLGRDADHQAVMVEVVACNCHGKAQSC